MDNNIISNLLEALQFSPDNIPLRIHLAETYLDLNFIENAEEEFLKVLSISQNNHKAKFGLANTYFQQDSFSKCNVILEDLISENDSDIPTLLLYTRALIQENNTETAIETYGRILEIDPSFTDSELDSKLRMQAQYSEEIDEEDEELNNEFIDKPDINFNDVGGMDNVKKEIDLKIIQPLKHVEIYKAYGKKTGGGIMLYGPPGCGKTFIAKATAGQINAKFINVSLNNILDMWVGNSEKNLHQIFELARANTPCVLFFDEIDALGASRSDMKQSSNRHLINQFLLELDGLESDNDGVLIMAATNTPWHLDAAFRRPGRFDRIIFVPPPDLSARASIFGLKLKGKPVEKIDYEKLAKKTQEYSGADIEALIDIAIEEILEDAIKDGVPKPIQTKNILNAIKKHKASTKEWFSSAKNFALYANNSGLYNDILDYLKIKM